jgi:hypothetical protein
MKNQVKETAAAGSVGAHAIAAAPSRFGAAPKKRNLHSYLVNYYDNMGNKLRMFPVNAAYKLGSDKKVKVVARIAENFNLDSVLAQLSNYENSQTVSDSEVVTYGVEDDKGNLMKVTILNTQADDFEAYISAYLSELKNFENSGVDLEDISLAELLYKLKDLFDVRDVEFPNIPSDVVYNADEASDSVENVQNSEFGAESDFGGEGEMGMDDEMGGPEGEMGGPEGEMGMDDEMGGPEGEMGAEGGMDEFGDEGGMDDMGAEGGMDEFGDEGGMDEFGDDESVEDFDDMEDESTTTSLLNNIIDMLKSQAEEQTARYDAEAERARADQAESSARAAEATLTHKEEIIAMQAEKDDQKAQEKNAKQESDLATYRYKQSRNMLDDSPAAFEGFAPDSLLMDAIMNEEDMVATDPLLVMRIHQNKVRQMMQAINDTTDPEIKKELQKELMVMKRELPLEKQKAKIRSTRMSLQQQDNAEDEQNLDPMNRQRQPMNAQRQDSRSSNSIGFMSETVSNEEYELLEEAAKRQFKRYGNKFVRKFRCYGGPKSGRMVSKAADCGVKKDPLKVRQGKRSARMKKGQRVRRTMMTKRKAPSKRVTTMNNILRGDK